MAVLLPQAIFIHVPKTGGTWIRHVLDAAGLARGELGRAHATPDELRHEPQFRDAGVVFAFVRHPLEWYRSYWAYRMKHGWHRPSPQELQAHIRTVRLDAHCRAEQFPAFVGNCLRRYPHGWVSQLYAHYTRGCTHVGRFERLRDDLLRILQAAGLHAARQLVGRFPVQNAAARDAALRAQCRYPAALALEVAQVERIALQTWGYAMDDALHDSRCGG
jgi:hypothetical protein